MSYKSFRTAMVLFLCAVLFLISACGKDEVKRVSQESLISQEAFAAAEALRAAYAKRDFSAIHEMSTPEGYSSIIDSVRHFDSVDLNFTPKWVEMDRGKVYLNITWKGVWTASGETFSERGMAVFLFEGRPLKLSRIIRGNPFRYPER